MRRTLWVAIALCGLAGPARAYIDSSPTLGKIINESQHIVVLQVDKVSVEKRAIIYKKIADLKGTSGADPTKHQVVDGSHPREPRAVLDWAVDAQESGLLAVCFQNGNAARICLGSYWYDCAAVAASWWRMTRGAPELSLSYCGSAGRLRDLVTAMLSGKEVAIPVLKHRLYENTGFRSVLFKDVPRGKDCPVWRVKGSLRMPGTAHESALTPVGEGAAGPEEVPALLAALKQAESRARAEAADELGAIGPAAGAATPALRTALKDPEALVRVSAAQALARIDAGDPAPVPLLADLLKDNAVKARKAAAYALGNLGADARDAVPALVQTLKDADPAVRWSAAESLGQVGAPAAAGVPALMELLSDPQCRAGAADSLGEIGAVAKEAIPALQELLKDADGGVRWTAALALLRIDPQAAKPALPMLVQRLSSGDEKVYWDARWYLLMMGPAAKDAAPAVAARLQAGDRWCANVLVAIAGPEATAAIPTLIHVLVYSAKCNDIPQCDWAAQNLAQIGQASAPAVIDLLKDPNAPVRARAVRCLAALGAKSSKEALPALLGALKDADPGVRIQAAEGLGGFKSRAIEASAALKLALRDSNLGVRLAASSSLIAVCGPEAQDALPVLKAALGDGDVAVRRKAAEALAELGPAVTNAAPILQAVLQDKDARARIVAAEALLKAKALSAKDALPVLLSALKDQDPWTRQHAAMSLGLLGAAAKEAIPALTPALQDPTAEVRSAAAEALKHIQLN
jgi:HEAT repeat protein